MAAFSFEAKAIREDGSTEPFSLAVPEPLSEDEYSYYSMLECGFLREEPFKIHGADRTQAVFLAVEFVRLSLQHAKVSLIDASGTPTELPELPGRVPPSDTCRK